MLHVWVVAVDGVSVRFKPRVRVCKFAVDN
jgi:hypothetical protein